MENHTYAIDYESYYDDNLSITIQGPKMYAAAADAYMVSIVGTDGLEYVGAPSDAPWDVIHRAEWVSHNRTFDRALWEANATPDSPFPSRWNCSADLCAYLGIPRSLAAATAQIYDTSVDKTVRAKMKGISFDSLSTAAIEELEEYALEDSRLCLRLWEDHKDSFPEQERLASEHTTTMALRGIPIDWAAWDAGYSALCVERDRIRDVFPWAGTQFEGKPVPLTSPRAWARWCAAEGVLPPASIAQKSEALQTWLSQDHPPAAVEIVEAFQGYRSINRTLKVVKSMGGRSEGDTCYPSLKYFGAHTGRWAGDAGLNMQNLTTREVGGVHLRHLFGCAPGETFVICDLGQIEARVLLWMVEDNAQLDLIRGGMDVYEAHARTTMGYRDPRPMSEGDPTQRKMAKARVLGLGYGCGASRFHSLAKEWGLSVTPAEADEIVTGYRKANPGITALWKSQDDKFRGNIGGDWFMKLPSGRHLPYRNIRVNQGTHQVMAETVLGHPLGYYGGKLVENQIQGIARDILRDKILDVEREIGNVVLHVHDEIVVKTSVDGAEEVAKRLEAIMTCSKDWYGTLPLAATATITRHFDK